MMQAWQIDKLGSISNLHQAQVPEPQPQAGEVVMEVLLAGLNPADRYLAEGQYPARPAMPHTLGRDAVGRIARVADDVTAWRPGELALILRGPVGVDIAGTFAQRVAVPVGSLARVPTGWSMEESAGASLVYMTAWQALTQWGNLQTPTDVYSVTADDGPDSTQNTGSSASAAVVLVTGASGGVGVAAVQLASALGYTVAALSRSPQKRARLSTLGAGITLDPADTQWRKRLLTELDGKKVDLVVDNIGGQQFSEILTVMGAWGKISVVGRLAGPVPEFNTASLFFRRLRIGGVSVGDYTPRQSHGVWQKVLETMAEKKQKPLVDKIFDFADLPAAFEHLAAGPMGKVLLRVGG